MSERRALRIVAMSRSAFSYKAKARDCSTIRLRMREITQTRIHYGCERVLVMLRREGWRDNHKRVYRTAAAGVPKRALVLVTGRFAEQNRSVAEVL